MVRRLTLRSALMCRNALTMLYVLACCMFWCVVRSGALCVGCFVARFDVLHLFLALSFKLLRDQPEIMSRSKILRSAFLLRESFDRLCFITIICYFVTLSNRLVLFVHKIALMVTRMV